MCCWLTISGTTVDHQSIAHRHITLIKLTKMIIPLSIHTRWGTILTNRDLHQERIAPEYTFPSHIDILLLLHHIDWFARDHKSLSNRKKQTWIPFPGLITKDVAIDVHVLGILLSHVVLSFECFFKRLPEGSLIFVILSQMILDGDIDRWIHLSVHWHLWERLNIVQVVRELISIVERDCPQWCSLIRV